MTNKKRGRPLAPIAGANDAAIYTAAAMRRRRLKLGMTQAALASAAAIAGEKIRNIERGQSSLVDEDLYAIAEALGCQPAALLVRVGRPPGKPG
jgi:transcriptional regulator with XRE-family HTH domain